MKKRTPPWHPAEYTSKQIAAFQDLAGGKATAEQQGMVLDWLVNNASGLYEEHFFEGSRETDYALGKAYVGRQVVKMVNFPKNALNALRQKEENPDG
jgi:hypothetical protein